MLDFNISGCNKQCVLHVVSTNQTIKGKLFRTEIIYDLIIYLEIQPPSWTHSDPTTRAWEQTLILELQPRVCDTRL